MAIDLILKKPLQFGKMTVSKLAFRDHVTAGDMLAFDTKGLVAQNIELIARLSNTEEELIKQLHKKDYDAAVDIVNQLFKDDVDDSVEDVEKK